MNMPIVIEELICISVTKWNIINLGNDIYTPNDGKQHIFLSNCRILPLVCDISLLYFQFLDKPTGQDNMKNYPHVVSASPHALDLSKLSYTHTNPHDWYIPNNVKLNDRVYDYGDYMNRIIMTLKILLYDDKSIKHHIGNCTKKNLTPDYSKLCPFFFADQVLRLLSIFWFKLPDMMVLHQLNFLWGYIIKADSHAWMCKGGMNQLPPLPSSPRYLLLTQLSLLPRLSMENILFVLIFIHSKVLLNLLILLEDMIRASGDERNHLWLYTI